MSAPLPPHRSTASGSAPGTCGELAQGVLPGGQRFHVTCPIDLHSGCEVTLHPAAGTTVHGVAPEDWKTRRALLLAAQELGLGPVRIEATIDSALPTAKGMASSTADMVAAMRAVAAAAQRTIADPTIARLAATVEATDGVMFPGVTIVDQGSGEILRRWDWWPAFTIAMFVPRTTRETATRTYPGQDRLAMEYAHLLTRLDDAVAARDPAAFAAQATRSAELNEAFVRNPLLPVLRDRADEFGGLGVCVGHSGTVAGLLFGEHEDARAADAAQALLPALPAETTARVVRISAPAAAAEPLLPT